MADHWTTTDRGFPIVRFHDAYNAPCSLQASSAIDDTIEGFQNPGTSYVWLGVDDPDPKVMSDVLVTTRMHLNREQVKELIQRLKEWLDQRTEN